MIIGYFFFIFIGTWRKCVKFFDVDLCDVLG